MDKKRFAIIIGVILLVVLAWKLAPLRQAAPDNGKLKVAATVAPLADIVKNVGGRQVEVMTVLPAGASAHTFEATVQQALDLQGVGLVFAMGHGLDDWVKPLASSLTGDKIITVDRNIDLIDLAPSERDPDEPDQAQDPHYWLSVPNAKIMARNIADALARTDPANASMYSANLEKYLDDLTSADAYMRQRLAAVQNKNLITHHNAWNYFAQEYGLNIVGTFEVAPGKEPTVQQLSALQDAVKRFGIKTVYVEPQLSDESIKPFTQDLKLNVAKLDPEGGADNLGYIDLMRYNADTIANNQ